MSKLERLIQQYCPDGVEWKRIEELCKTKTPPCKLKTNEYQEYGVYPIIDQGQKPIAGYTDNEDALVDDGEYILYGDHTCIVKYHNGCFAQGADGLKILISPSNNSKYVYYAFCAYNLPSTEYKRHWTQAKEIEIPVPPLPVQEEIVRILDAFTELQAELQAELQKRKQQYNFYRDTLLTNYTSEQNVKEYCLGELFEFKNGLNASKEQFGHGKPIVNYVNVYKKNSIMSSDLTGRVELDASTIERYRVKRGDVFFTRTSETREEVGFASVLLENIEDCVFSGFVLRARPITNVILPEFCKYCFATYTIRKQIIQSSTLTTRALTNGTSLSKVKIMIPPLEEQNRIVAILDHFDTLTNDLSSGLPAEMEKRKQQYEYYRDKLLTFKRITNY